MVADTALAEAFGCIVDDPAFVYRERFASITSEDWQHYAELQPADLIARRVRQGHEENLVFNRILENPESKNDAVESIMKEALPFIDISTPLDDLSKMISGDRTAVLVKDFKANRNFIITRSDIAEALAK